MADDCKGGDCNLDFRIGKNTYQLFVMDVDGTLTDGKIYMSSAGEVFKAFDIKDGYGIKKQLLLEGVRK